MHSKLLLFPRESGRCLLFCLIKNLAHDFKIQFLDIEITSPVVHSLQSTYYTWLHDFSGKPENSRGIYFVYLH